MKEIIKNILTNLGQVKLPAPSYFDSLETYTVKKVSDADTFNVVANGSEVEMTVRFVYIDTPETPKGWGDSQVEKMNHKNKNPIYRSQFEWGEKGKDRLQELVQKSDNQVKVKVTGEENRPGRSPRCFGEVYLLDGTFVQHILVKEGLARVYYDYISECPREIAIMLFLAEADAEINQRGIWQELQSEFMAPWVFRSLKKKQKNFLKDIGKELKAGSINEAEFEAKFELKLQQQNQILSILQKELISGLITQAKFEDKCKEELNHLFA
ncbi:nuclease (SNase-like) [Trichodesmium erythraeum IMS101]|uniref:Nuclease (SNase-like) n=1 Tax=Trichodesmium erythraeum (strain IMS101) TaxID=203124 RepID=Q117P1_TRIEI|nr:thermonuclease family protein [Trichodesmium erythraeum GBRTRLIN201]MDE5092900.1 thermonuclease family protein [Trichodesmium sp. St11_bin5]MDT9338309.1 thermonuclease family protein [Trichodesmium erythraeum 21-75]